ncbi:MAG: hypothetical protein U0P45_10440 [Acidimicrobiales bacterium]
MLAFVLIFVALVIVGQPRNAQADDARPTVLNHPARLGRRRRRPGMATASPRSPGSPPRTPMRWQMPSVPNRGKTVPVVVVRDGKAITIPVDLKPYTYHDDVDGIDTLGTARHRDGPAPNEPDQPGRGPGADPKEFGQIMWLSAKGLGPVLQPVEIKDTTSWSAAPRKSGSSPAAAAGPG